MGPNIKIAARKRLNTRPQFVVTMSPTQSDQSAAIGTKYGPYGPSEDLQDPQKGHFGPKRVLYGPLVAKNRPNTRPKCVVTMTKPSRVVFLGRLDPSRIVMILFC